MKGKPRFASCLQFMLGRQKLLVPNSEGISGGVVAGAQRAPVAATTIAASACEDGGGGDVKDDTSFFDLEFVVPGDESAASNAEEEQVELNFAVAGEYVAPGGGEVVAVDAVDAAAGVETSEAKDGAEEAETAEATPAPALPLASLLRPATKFRVLLLKLRRRRTPRRRRRGGAGAARSGNGSACSRWSRS